MTSHPKHARDGRAARLARPLLLALLALSASSARAQQPDASASAVPQVPDAAREVRLTLTVTDDKGRYVGGVTREHVEVFEGKSSREIRSFDKAEEHASVGVLFDISGSMRDGRDKKLELVRQAFARFVRQSSPMNEYFLRAFNKKQFELADWTRADAAIKEALDKIAPATLSKDGDGGTALYEACAAALAKLAGGPRARRVLLIFTDGGSDNYSRQVRQKALKRMVRDSGALLYAVAVYDKHDPPSLDPVGQADLDEMVAASGGRAYFTAGVRELNEAVDQITVELRHQYVVAFAAADAAKKGELNKVRVRIKLPPDYKSAPRVRSREGYLTPE